MLWGFARNRIQSKEMHELAVTEGILRTIIDASERNGTRRISQVNLVIGELSTIVDDSIQFYFDLLSKGTLAEKAILRFRREPSFANCLECGYKYEVRAPLDPYCQRCGSDHLRITGSREFFIESIEVEGEDTNS
jgi:hydrogenase nickel incorporation protein HypA/HybF